MNYSPPILRVPYYTFAASLHRLRGKVATVNYEYAKSQFYIICNELNGDRWHIENAFPLDIVTEALQQLGPLVTYHDNKNSEVCIKVFVWSSVL
jgi:hypothetical protein